MKTNDAGVALIMRFEGCSLKAYKLTGEKYYTIGYGHSFDESIKADTIWTQAQAKAALKKDLAKFEAFVTEDAPHGLNENQFAALVSYTYNRGRGGLRQLVKACKTLDDYPAKIVELWGSATLFKQGLIRRREAERDLWMTPTEANPHKRSQRVLKRGSTGDDVAWLQWELNWRGYALADDGEFGPNTEKKLMLFQRANYIDVDGICGKQTYGKLV